MRVVVLNPNVLYSPCCHTVYHVTYHCQYRCFTAIHKSFFVASWDSKVSIVCTLQNLARRKYFYIFFLDAAFVFSHDHHVLIQL